MARLRPANISRSGLDRFEPFAALSANGRAILAQGTNFLECPANTIILHKGQPVSGAYVVLEGRLRVYTISPGGNEATMYFVDAGETCVLALNCLFSDLLYPGWVQAERKTQVAVVPGNVYRRLFETEPGIQNLTVHALSALVYRLMDELEKVHSSNHRQRLARFVLLHANSDGMLRMTQQQIARHLGTTREVVARLVGEFVEKGWLHTQRGAVRIGDLFGLRGELLDS